VEETTLIQPAFGDVKTWRDVVHNNAATKGVDFTVRTSQKFLPQVLTDLGFFASNTRVKKNRLDLWHEIDGDTTVNLQWATITIHFAPEMVS
jgi:hypothetical protein